MSVWVSGKIKGVVRPNNKVQMNKKLNRFDNSISAKNPFSLCGNEYNTFDAVDF